MEVAATMAAAETTEVEEVSAEEKRVPGLDAAVASTDSRMEAAMVTMVAATDAEDDPSKL